ncbi:CoA transferase, partial [Chloroflexota bacterium]
FMKFINIRLIPTTRIPRKTTPLGPNLSVAQPAAYSRGWGNILVGLSGFSQIAGWPDREPADLQTYTDYIGPHYVAAAIIAALLYRQRTGKGMYLDVSQNEASLQFLAPLILDYTVNGRIANRMGNRSTYAAPHAAYRCRGDDRWCTIAVSTDEEWQNFVKVIGNPAWTKDSRFSTFLARKKNEEELDRLVEAWTINHTAEEVMEMMQAVGVPAGTAETGEDLVENDPQLAHEHYFQRVDHPEGGTYLVHPSPIVPSKSYHEVRRSPLLGEHNEYVLKELLGLSDDEIADLVIDGAVE